MFDRSIYLARRARLKERLHSGIGLFLGNDESPMNYADNGYRFRQDSSFLYFFGLDSAGLAAVIDFDEGTETIYGDDLTVEDFVWMGPQLKLQERALRVGIERTAPLAELLRTMTPARAAGRTIHFLPPYRAENKIKLLDLLGVPPVKAASRASVELIQAVVDLRAVKGPEEVREIEAAVDTSVDMHVAAMRMVRHGARESDIAAEVHRIALAAGGDIAFPIIATIHGETLHNHFHGNVLQSGGMFLLDAGAESALHYAGDLSSTVPVDKSFTPRQKDIYSLSLAAHEAAAGALGPGVRQLDVHLLACRTIAAGLKDMDLMKGDVDAAVREGAHALFFPCGVGHMMGLDVHDMEDLGEVYVGYEGKPKSTQFGLKSLRLARELRPGFVLTIEPGIYFIPELIDQWEATRKLADFLEYGEIDKWRDFGGVRNEENFLITPEGKRRLGKPKPKTLDEIGALRS